MFEEYRKDKDGWTWYFDGEGWSLLRHEDQPCYVHVPLPKVEQEYGPLRPLTKYEQTYFHP